MPAVLLYVPGSGVASASGGTRAGGQQQQQHWRRRRRRTAADGGGQTGGGGEARGRALRCDCGSASDWPSGSPSSHLLLADTAAKVFMPDTRGDANWAAATNCRVFMLARILAHGGRHTPGRPQPQHRGPRSALPVNFVSHLTGLEPYRCVHNWPVQLWCTHLYTRYGS